MHCLDLRRQLLIDPRHWDDEREAHVGECAACARAREQALMFEAALRQALLLDAADDGLAPVPPWH